MQNVFDQTLTLFIVMIAGFLVAKLNIFTPEVRQKLSVFLLTVTSPCLIIKNFHIDYSKELMVNIMIVAAVAFVMLGVAILTGWFVWKKSPEDKRPILRYATAFPNCGYLGFPVLGGLFGTEGVIYAAIFVMVFHVYLWTLGVLIFTGKPSKWYKPFTRPPLIAVIIGVVIFVFSIKFPTPIYNAFSMLGGMTSPLAMLLVGSYLADSKFKDIFGEKFIYMISFFRFILWPVITYFALRPFNLSEALFASCVLITAMPAAANTVIFATRYNKNPKFASELVAFTTLVAMVSIPIWMYFITGGVG